MVNSVSGKKETVNQEFYIQLNYPSKMKAWRQNKDIPTFRNKAKPNERTGRVVGDLTFK